MAAPTITTIYPADLDTGIPIAESLIITFDRGVDLSVAKNHVVLYGPDFDKTSGPDSAQWVDNELGENPFFLRSPSFKGVVDCTYELLYVDGDGNPIDPQPTIEVLADEAGLFQQLIVTPKKALAADAEYKLHIIGDPDDTGKGIASRTVLDVVADPGNASTTAEVVVYGGYTGDNDTVVIEITDSGDMGEAKYRWYYQSLGVGSAVTGKVTSRKYRRLEDGLQIRFDGSGFVDGDIYTVVVSAPERLATSTTITFTTGDGSYSVAPGAPSTPATSEPPSSTLPELVDGGFLEILEVDPADGATNQPLDTTTITITFSADLDASTVTQDTVKVTAYPISGVYSDTGEPKELLKDLQVSANKLIITL